MKSIGNLIGNSCFIIIVYSQFREFLVIAKLIWKTWFGNLFRCYWMKNGRRSVRFMGAKIFNELPISIFSF